MPQAYQVKTKNLFLTYPTIENYLEDVTEFSRESCLEDLICFLKDIEIGGELPIAVSGAVEEYPDRPNHYHAHSLVSFDSSKTCNLNHYEFFGISCHFKRVSHGQLNLKNICEYFKKDGCFTINHTFAAEKERINWSAVFACASKEDATKWLQTHCPREYVTQFNSIQNFLNGHFRGTPSNYETPPEFRAFTTPQPLIDWFDEEFARVG